MSALEILPDKPPEAQYECARCMMLTPAEHMYWAQVEYIHEHGGIVWQWMCAACCPSEEEDEAHLKDSGISIVDYNKKETP